MRGQFTGDGFFCPDASLVKFNQCPAIWWVDKVSTLSLLFSWDSLRSSGGWWLVVQTTRHESNRNPEPRMG